VLEQLAGDDDVELAVVERKELLDVSPAGRDPSPRRLAQRAPVDVDAGHLVAGEVRLRQRAGAAAEVEDTLTGAADVPLEERRSLVTAVDEIGSALPLMLVVALAQLLERRRPLDCAS
jgi:hypothetical protein